MSLFDKLVFCSRIDQEYSINWNFINKGLAYSEKQSDDLIVDWNNYLGEDK